MYKKCNTEWISSYFSASCNFFVVFPCIYIQYMQICQHTCMCEALVFSVVPYPDIYLRDTNQYLLCTCVWLILVSPESIILLGCCCDLVCWYSHICLTVYACKFSYILLYIHFSNWIRSFNQNVKNDANKNKRSVSCGIAKKKQRSKYKSKHEANEIYFYCESTLIMMSYDDNNWDEEWVDRSD